MNIIEILQKGLLRECYLLVERMCSFIPDDLYLKIVYRIRLGKKLNLNNPKTFNEKLQWLKINNRKDLYTSLVDKYEVKEIVGKKIGYEHIIPTLGVWDKVDDIDFNSLPNKFVLKCTHDSGSICICDDKEKFDIKKAKKKLLKAMKRNYYWGGREWPYKNVKPRIIAEPFMDFLGKNDSYEYKLSVFNGEVKFSTICKGKAHSKLSERTNDFYDRDFKQLPFWSYYKHSDNPITEKPVFLDTMIDYSEILAEGMPYARVDFYENEGKIIFGEMTFFTWGGFNKFEPNEWDLKLGEMIKLE